MPAPVLPGHPGLYAKDRAPDRRTMGKNRAAPLQERQLSPVRHATHGRGPTGLSGMAQRRRAGADSPSAPGKQAKSAKGGRPAGGDRTSGRDASLPQKVGSKGEHWRRIPAESIPAGFRRMQGEPGTTLLSPARLQKRKEGPLSESLHLSDQSGMRITSWIYAHRAVRRAGPCCGSRYGRCRTDA